MANNKDTKLHGGDFADKALSVKMNLALAENNRLQRESISMAKAEAEAEKKHRAELERSAKQAAESAKQSAEIEAERLALAKAQAERKKRIEVEQDKVFKLGRELKNSLKEKDIAQKYFSLCNIQEMLNGVDSVFVEDIAYKDKLADSQEICKDELTKIKKDIGDDAFDLLIKFNKTKQELSKIISSGAIFTDSDIESLKNTCIQINISLARFPSLGDFTSELSAAERIITTFEKEKEYFCGTLEILKEKRLYLPNVIQIVLKIFEARGISPFVIDSITDIPRIDNNNNFTVSELSKITDEFSQIAVSSLSTSDDVQNAFDELSKRSEKESFSIVGKIVQNNLSKIPHFVCSSEFPQVLNCKADRKTFGYYNNNNAYIIFLANAVIYIDTEHEFYSFCPYSEIKSKLPLFECSVIDDCAKFMISLNMAGEAFNTPEEFKPFEENLTYFLKIVIPIFSICKKYSSRQSWIGTKIQLQANEQSLVSSDNIAILQSGRDHIDVSKKGFSWHYRSKSGFVSWNEFLQSPEHLTKVGLFGKVTWQQEAITSSRNIYAVLMEICNKCGCNAGRIEGNPVSIKTNKILKRFAYILFGAIFFISAIVIVSVMARPSINPVAAEIVVLREKAEKGDANSQNELAEYYLKGKVGTKDAKQAAAWYRKAAEKGLADAQCNLGLCYENGEGVAKDAAEAVAWYKKAAVNGYGRAQHNLGVCYYNGTGVAKDEAEAVNWWRKAAEQGNGRSQFNLGLCCLKGEGVAKDATEAVKWYRKAAEQGLAAAQSELALCYCSGTGVAKDEAEGIKWFQKAAEQGDTIAQYNLGVCYENGISVVKDAKQAVAWYQKAAEKGDVKAQKALKTLVK